MKADVLGDEDSIAANIAELRERFPRTQDLYREACILLFFRHGVTPTANKLYQLVRKGSMSAPTEAVHEFWERLRERSRVTVEHADLPDVLKAAAGEMVATLWQSAQSLSRNTLAQYQSEAAAAVVEAEASEAQARADHAATAQALELSRSQTHAREELVDRLGQELSEAAAANAGLEARLEELRRQVTTMQESSEQLRKTHTLDLEKLSARTELAEQRFVDMEKRALVEIDRERTASAKLQKTLESERAAHAGVVERLHVDHNRAQATIGQLREQVGSLQNAVSSLEKDRDRERGEVSALRLRLETAIGQAAADHARAAQLQAEVDRHRRKSEARRDRVDPTSRGRAGHQHAADTVEEQPVVKAQRKDGKA
jgi:chromosome segregation ATPase